ncbi:MAG: nuclear transport factor 2 family protein [Bauldia sp.]|nr:nuclear transport factor 2 family protein [Bauldia sp.]
MPKPTWPPAPPPTTRILLATMLVLGLAASQRTDAAEGPEIDRLALELIDRFYDDLAPDNAALSTFLGDGFQIIGSDGLRFDRDRYLDFPKAVTRYDISDLVARRDGDVLTATFKVSYLGKFEGIARDVPRLARIAVFHETDEGWKVQALAALGTGENAIESEAGRIVGRWQAAIASGELDQILALAAPDFQIQRPDGQGDSLADYLNSAPTPKGRAVVSDLVVTSFNNTLVARYNLRTDESDDGESISPRLTVFERIDGAWLAAAEAEYGVTR